MLNPSVKIEGLEQAMKAMQAAFPNNESKQRGLLNSAMRAASKNTILADAKQRARRGDGSGSLSEALAIRAANRRKLRNRGAAAGIEILPVRSSMKALAKYIQFYYTQRGRTPPASIMTSGIRHGHLVEFGSLNNPANPFLWPAAQSQNSAYINRFAADLRQKTEAAVAKEALKR
jgi:hypothetical protein